MHFPPWTMDDEKLNQLAKELQQCKSDCLANAAEIDALKARVIAICEMLEDRSQH